MARPALVLDLAARRRGRCRAPSRIARLALRSPTGEFAAIARRSPGRGRARRPGRRPPRRRPRARTRLGGVIRRAVKIIRAARDQPTRRVSSWVPPPPGMTPTLTPRAARRRPPRRQTTRSQDSAISRPPPSAKPSTAASAGTGRSSTPRYAARATGRCARSSSSVKLLRSLRSAPTQNALGLGARSRRPPRTVASAASSARSPRPRCRGHRGRDGVHRLGPVEHQLGDVPAVAVPLDRDQGCGRCCSCVSSSAVGSSLTVGVPLRRPCGGRRAARRSSLGVTGPMPRRVRRRSAVVSKPLRLASAAASASSTSTPPAGRHAGQPAGAVDGGAEDVTEPGQRPARTPCRPARRAAGRPRPWRRTRSSAIAAAGAASIVTNRISSPTVLITRPPWAVTMSVARASNRCTMTASWRSVIRRTSEVKLHQVGEADDCGARPGWTRSGSASASMREIAAVRWRRQA